MQATVPQRSAGDAKLGRKLGYLMLPPLLIMVLFTLVLATIVDQYRSDHEGRIYTGVRLGGVELGGKTTEEAQLALAEESPNLGAGSIKFVDPASGQQWTKTHTDLGMSFDEARTVEAAMAVGRSGGPLNQVRDTFESWYYGRSISPVVVFDEGQLDQAVIGLAEEVNQPAIDASIAYQDNAAEFQSGQAGRVLDTGELRSRLLEPVGNFREAEVELLVHETYPALYDDSEVALEIQRILDGPMSFYLPEPLDDLDLGTVELPQELLASWLRVDVQETGDGSLQRLVLVDENAARHWLRQFADEAYRDPVNARFYSAARWTWTQRWPCSWSRSARPIALCLLLCKRLRRPCLPVRQPASLVSRN
jgi:hypothetical protein